MSYHKLSKDILAEIEECMSKTSEDRFDEALSLLDGAKRIFVCGAGRSRLAGAAFVMRLIHMGISAFLVGDVTTPAICKGDLLVICSGSGETKSMKLFCETAVKNEANILLFTTKDSSSLAKSADCTLVIHAKAAKNIENDNALSVQPMSNLFAQTLGLTMDMLVIELMKKRNVDEALMKEYHANLE